MDKPTRKQNPYYVSNKQLLEQMIHYKQLVEQAKLNGEQKPRLPEYVGYAIMTIAKKLATNGNFSSYSYKDEMISDGIENCIMYIDNFDPAKSNNPFAYITQIIKFSFIRRIQKEKKQQYIKYKNMEQIIPNWDTEFNAPAMHDDVSSQVITAYELTLKNKRDKLAEKNAEKLALLE